jgi:hypothetical protein
MSKAKTVGNHVFLNLHYSLAFDFFRESGDLPANGFPATTELAHLIGKELGLGQVEGHRKTVEMSKKTRKTSKKK